MTNFSARELPWTKVGTVIDTPGVTAAEAIEIADLGFDVKTVDAGFLSSDGTWQDCPGRVAIVRADTEEFFSFATDAYHPVQYREAFDFIDHINPEIVAAGSLRGGRQGFVVTKLPESSDLNLTLLGQDDPHTMYVLLRTSQDLTLGLEIMITTLRHKCMNQLTLPSMKTGVPRMWAIRHMSTIKQRMAQAEQLITSTANYATEFERIANRLANIDINWDNAEKILTRVLPDKPQRQTAIDGIHVAWKDDETNGFYGNGWGLVQSVDEYFEWTRSSRRRTDESRFNDSLDGLAAKMTSRTAHVLLATY